MIAIAFLNPLLLSGLGLAAVPILIHWLSKRQFRRIDWAATRFLLEAERENRRRVRVEQWLLLALRCLAMGLLALLVARPFVQPGLVASLLGGRGQVQRLIVLDDSASLGYRTGTAVDFSALRDTATRLVSWLRQEAAADPLSLYLTSQPDAPFVTTAHLADLSPDDLEAKLARLKPTDLPARPRNLLERLAGALETAGKQTRADLYLLSDFQRSEWLPASGGAGRAAFEPLRQLEHGRLRAVLIASAGGPRDNAAILDTQLERPQTVAGLPAIVHAVVANYSRQPLRDARLQVEIDGAALPAATVEPIEPGQTRTVAIEATFPDEGYRELSLGLAAGDGLPADDVHRLAVRVKPAMNILLVNGQPSADPLKDEVYLLRSALAPPGPFSSGMRIETADPSSLESSDLGTFDCVLLCNAPPPGDVAAALLLRYVQAGGGLGIFLGDEAGDGADYNRDLFADGRGVLPLALDGSPQRADSPTGVGLIRTIEHPVTAIFPAGGQTLSEYVRFRTFYRTVEAAIAQPAPPSSAAATSQPAAVVLARFTDAAQTPALIERSAGRGRVLLFTSTADLDWNDWARAADGSYVVTMLELVQYLAGRGVNPPAFVAGQRLELVLPPEEYEPLALVKSPAFPDEPAVEARLSDSTATSGQTGTLEGPIAARVGTYTFELGRRQGGIENRPVCVNLDPVESDLATASETELAAALAGVSHEYLRAAESFVSSDDATRRELWPTVLVVLALVLMGEHTLAWWFGRSGRARGG